MTEENNNKGNEKYALIRVRGEVRVPQKIRDTMKMLNLDKKNSCVFYDMTEPIRGMIKKVEDFVTWGEVSEEVLKELEDKYGKKEIYHLNPPRKGFGRKGIKTHFKSGGGIGYRGEKINDLIRRMI